MNIPPAVGKFVVQLESFFLSRFLERVAVAPLGYARLVIHLDGPVAHTQLPALFDCAEKIKKSESREAISE